MFTVSECVSSVIWCGAGGSTPNHLSLLYWVLKKGDFHVENGKFIDKSGIQVKEQICISGGIVPWLVISTSRNNQEAIDKILLFNNNKVWRWSNFTILFNRPWSLGLFGNMSPVENLFEDYLKTYPLLIPTSELPYFVFRDKKTRNIVIQKPTKKNLTKISVACMSSPHLGLRNTLKSIIKKYSPVDPATIFRPGGYHFTQATKRFLKAKHAKSKIKITTFDPIGGAHLFFYNNYITKVKDKIKSKVREGTTLFRALNYLSFVPNLFMMNVLMHSLYRGVLEGDIIYTRYFEQDNIFIRALNRIINLNFIGNEHSKYLSGEKKIEFIKLVPSKMIVLTDESKVR